MVRVAQQMEQQKFTVPLLIGGATTSRKHTAIKIAPAYSQEVIHVLDASRAVSVVSALMDPVKRVELATKNHEQQAELREMRAAQGTTLVPLSQAIERRVRLEFGPDECPTPSFTGVRRLERVSLGDIAEYIDWTFFFVAWELNGKFPDILQHPERGAAARELYEQGRKLLDRIIAENLLEARAVYGFWPAKSVGEDIVLSHGSEQVRLSMLRQQKVRTADEPCRSLVDFIAPEAGSQPDFLGGFAVTAGIGCDELARHFEHQQDDYSAIIVKSLADRLAEALAEMLHERARRDWGYGVGEQLTKQDLTDERYRGIRPAYGYPACPDHTEKTRLFDLLGARELGIDLTETFSMSPAASVSGLYFGHPKARYFNVGKLGRDQIEDYASRKGWAVAEAERWLGPNLGYEPHT
jgi:5-methyltetrahydrofolate--homocysteine methyltransferase